MSKFVPRPFIIAGPCGVESREQIMAAAEGISRTGIRMLRGGLWKPRTHPGSFEGVGEAGAQWLRDAGISGYATRGRPPAWKPLQKWQMPSTWKSS